MYLKTHEAKIIRTTHEVTPGIGESAGQLKSDLASVPNEAILTGMAPLEGAEGSYRYILQFTEEQEL